MPYFIYREYFQFDGFRQYDALKIMRNETNDITSRYLQQLRTLRVDPPVCTTTGLLKPTHMRMNTYLIYQLAYTSKYPV